MLPDYPDLKADLRATWASVVEEARDVRLTTAPAECGQEKFLLMLFVMAFPYRGTPDVIRFLGRSFNKVWFLPPPIDH